ncbi:tRNA 2-thiouridine(34) synthase MnmA [Prosthecochloris sp. HL-130-GSB]|jgi:tRNA-uridine 2-sulfurtransferase|uniref:tRNA 2-thiouridine(34) synthase MnmA n=1 Tax=Prosthecochloris sp. HL-130-GSB TaxID=1974213 RepID=UPI000A1C1156|nr:tRNA 2-thiouridine(34) synthase MnmA [Prosthecochloris sp. HL-130-GSB]ARM31487.1 tRNA 2-thiouridine(34) synthase MnmA [Prosthecochloris sp. HL-130-GSB]
MTARQHVIAGISGGVDSAVAACLLIEQGYRVTGLYLRTQGPAEDSLAPERMAMEISSQERFRFPVYSLNFSSRFSATVIRNFQESYLSGRTPNPCTLCNKAVKWAGLMKGCELLDGDMIATGHYARIDRSGTPLQMLRGIDTNKDQSYFLWMLGQDELNKTLFPLGDLTKTQVRELAHRFGVHAAEKKESQEICFVPDNDYRNFLDAAIPGLREKLQKGDILDESGNVLGHHKGYPFYTVGQRKGLGISAEKPLYVNRIDSRENRIYVGPKKNLECLRLQAGSVNWISIPPPLHPLRAEARIRYRDKPEPCTITPVGEKQAEIVFDLPKYAVTPGQAVVFYQKDIVLGGGIIEYGFHDTET